MAGSYSHVVDKRTGKFTGTYLLDHLGDAWEALEEMYGMIWFLASGNAMEVERARQHYRAGIAASPGIEERARAVPSKFEGVFKTDNEWVREVASYMRKDTSDHPDACDCLPCRFVRRFDKASTPVFPGPTALPGK
jgi:hypothetical protein